MILGVVLRCEAADEKASDKAMGSYTGVIESFDLKPGVLKVKSETSSMTFQIVKLTKIVGIDKREATLSDLKARQKVRVDYREEKGITVANQINLTEQESIPRPAEEEKPIKY
jgi:hypothetical protein